MRPAESHSVDAEGSGRPASRAPLLSVRHLTTRFHSSGRVVTAVDDVSFDLYPGETLGIVGESGCGKTATSLSLLRLLPPRVGRITPGSEVRFGGRDLLTLTERELRGVRGARIAMVFQDPMASLNPVLTVGSQLSEVLRCHTRLGRRARRERVVEMLRGVEIPRPEERAAEYPHQLSGGMRQRVMVAMALACEPDVLIADEPTTALDVTVQAQILRLIQDRMARRGAATLLITHDLGVVAQACDRVVVMYAGQVVECGGVRDIFHRPRHPYTRALLDSMPRAGSRREGERLTAIEGVVPSLAHLPSGCRFYDRCPRREDRCAAEPPALADTVGSRDVRCHLPLEREGGAS